MLIVLSYQSPPRSIIQKGYALVPEHHYLMAKWIEILHLRNITIKLIFIELQLSQKLDFWFMLECG